MIPFPKLLNSEYRMYSLDTEIKYRTGAAPLWLEYQLFLQLLCNYTYTLSIYTHSPG